MVPNERVDFGRQVDGGIRFLIEQGERERARAIFDQVMSSENARYVELLNGNEYNW